MWAKRGDPITSAQDLIQAVKTLCGIKSVHHHYPNAPKTSDSPMVVVKTMAHNSNAEWGGREIATINTYSLDIYVDKEENFERFVKDIMSNLLLNDVRTVGRMDSREGKSQRWVAYLTVRCAYDGNGRMYRGM